MTGRKTQFTYELQECQRQQGLAGIGSRDFQVRYAERRVQVCPLFFDVLEVDDHFRFLSAAGRRGGAGLGCGWGWGVEEGTTVQSAVTSGARTRSLAAVARKVRPEGKKTKKNRGKISYLPRRVTCPSRIRMCKRDIRCTDNGPAHALWIWKAKKKRSNRPS